MKEFIKNRKGQKIAVLVEKPENPKRLAFIMHGLGGFKEQPHIQAIAEAFLESGYTVIRFDTTNTFGESEGNYENATTTNYYEDLEDVIEWSKTQPWYQEPLVLSGHSLGGICTALYAEKYPEKVKALVPISAVVSGKLSSETPYHKSIEEEWRKIGWLEEKSISMPGVIKHLKWSHMEDRLKYDLLPNAKKLAMPVLLIVGEKDTTTPLEHQKILFDDLPGPKELRVIKGAAHTFRKEEHIAELKEIIKNWLSKLED
ncbi:MAG: alpha/beta hydrolase [bacterium]|nr:alpha/beta hydrolase [bacterium]